MRSGGTRETCIRECSWCPSPSNQKCQASWSSAVARLHAHSHVAERPLRTDVDSRKGSSNGGASSPSCPKPLPSRDPATSTKNPQQNQCHGRNVGERMVSRAWNGICRSSWSFAALICKVMNHHVLAESDSTTTHVKSRGLLNLAPAQKRKHQKLHQRTGAYISL